MLLNSELVDQSGGRPKRRGNQQNPTPAPAPKKPLNLQGRGTTDLQKLLNQIRVSKEFILNSSFYQSFLDIYKNTLLCEDLVLEILCLGIGSIVESENALLQFSLLLLFQELFAIQEGKCLIFDPVFTPVDLQIIKHFGLVCADNLAGKHLISTKTFVYMPHCTEGLYCNLFYTNWNLQNLTNIFLLGNSFDSYIYRKVGRKDSLVDVVVPYLKEHPLNYQKDTELQLSFNNLSIHIFDESLLKEAPVDFWETSKMSESQSQEIIRELTQDKEPQNDH